MVEQFLHQELQESAINESDFLLKNSRKHPNPTILTTLNEISLRNCSTFSGDLIEDHNIDRHINDLDKGIYNLVRTVCSNLTSRALHQIIWPDNS